jgi:hypothetical protein
MDAMPTKDEARGALKAADEARDALRRAARPPTWYLMLFSINPGAIVGVQAIPDSIGWVAWAVLVGLIAVDLAVLVRTRHSRGVQGGPRWSWRELRYVGAASVGLIGIAVGVVLAPEAAAGTERWYAIAGVGLAILTFLLATVLWRVPAESRERVA